MTDSMKFGPEWLRNLSADTVNLATISGFNTAVNNQPKESTANSITPRNMFPEFRYGREEMLSLFEKSCCAPDILPLYKTLFVEKVQFPLAMTPCTDEDVPQNNPSLRTTWVQRSPSGFSHSTRGMGRVSMTERCRLRGKPTYHGSFIRPGFEDDQRSNLIRSERAWSDRNGSSDISGTNNGISIEWNGNLSASPRREYPSNFRNHENWRKNKLEEKENSVDAIPTTEGWRNSGNGNFINTNRWGRSSSWRDEESSTYESSSGGVLQRSVSSTSNIIGKNFTESLGGTTSKNMCTSNFSNTTCNTIDNMQMVSQSSKSDVDELPEWATEHTSKEGGTFDALGAFHGSVDLSNNHPLPQDINRDSVGIAQPERCISAEKLNSIKCQESSTKVNQQFSIEDNTHLEKNVKYNALSKNNSISNYNDGLDRIKSSAESMNVKSNNGDISEQMREVADVMIQKLIMEDEVKERVDGNFKKEQLKVQLQPNQHTIIDYHTSINESETILQTLSLENDNLQAHSIAKINPNRTNFINNNLSSSVNETGNNVVAASPLQLETNIPCAKDLWFYRDPQSKVQGPFTAIEMTEWFKAGYFNEILFVRRMCDTRFRALGELIKICNGNIPFSHNHLLPLDLDNYQPIGNNINPLFENYEDIKGNVTATADSVNAAVKNYNSIDVSNMLNLHFQMLQEQYISHQENLILAELSENEIFQRLTKSERDAVIRQRVRIPEYLSSLSGLSNSLAVLNPSASDQLYSTLATYSKKNIYTSFQNNQEPHGSPQVNILTNEVNHQKFDNINSHHRIQYDTIFPSIEPSELNNTKCFLPEYRNSQTSLNNDLKVLPKYSEEYEKTIGENGRPNIVNNIFQDQNPLSNHLVCDESLRTLWSSNINNSILKGPLVPNNFNQSNEQWSNCHSSASNHINVGSDFSNGITWKQQNIENNLFEPQKELKPNSLIEASNKIENFGQEETLQDNLEHSIQEEKVKNIDIEEVNMEVGAKNATILAKHEKSIIKKNTNSSQVTKVKEDITKLKDLLDDKRKSSKKKETDHNGSRNEDSSKPLTNNYRKTNSFKNENTSQSHISLTKQIKDMARIQSSVAPWSSQASEFNNSSGPGLAEIQKAERREKRADQQRLTEQIQKSPINDNSEPYPKWNALPMPVKSIAEIQAEEAKKFSGQHAVPPKKRDDQSACVSSAGNNFVSNGLSSGNVWSGQKSWMPSKSSIWEEKQKSFNVSENLTSHNSPNSLSKNFSQKNQSSSGKIISNGGTVKKSQTVSVMQTTTSKSSAQKTNKSQIKETVENKKNNKQKALAQSFRGENNLLCELQSEFTSWCSETLSNMNTIVDVPTFVTFLKDVDSPFEVKDYIRMYLGESKDTNDFAKQFLERRSKYRNFQRAQNAHNDDMCKPAPALTPLTDSSDIKAKNKKLKKAKMTKLDSRILGFSVTAAEGRINVGDRDYAEAP